MEKDRKQKKRWSAGKWLLFLAVLLVVLAAVPLVNEMIPKRVNVKYITFDGDIETEYMTRAHKVSEFVKERGYEIGDADIVLGLYEKDAMDLGPADIANSLKRLYMRYTGKLGKNEPLLPFEHDLERTAGSMRKDNTPVSLVGSATESDADSDEDDEKSAGADEFIQDGMTIEILKAETHKANIGGKKEKLVLYPGTVEKTLDYNDIELDEDDIVEPALEEELDFDDRIEITRVEIVTEEKKETIKPKEEGAVFDKSLASGTIVRTEGKPGKAVYKYTYKYVNGKKKKTKKEFDRWIKRPTNIQLRFGTSVTGETGPVEFGETFIGNCTAYYFGKNAHGARGTCHYGTCAVDPSVIPYGTKLYVEGYGTAVANDCGGAVKGHIIDLYMRSTKECFSWGRRNKKVYILK